MDSKGESSRTDGLVAEIARDLEPLIPRFLENRRRDFKALATAVEKRDVQTVLSLSHSLKGNFLSYGFRDLGNLASSLNTEAKRGDFTQIETVFNRMTTMLAGTDVRYI